MNNTKTSVGRFLLGSTVVNNIKTPVVSFLLGSTVVNNTKTSYNLDLFWNHMRWSAQWGAFIHIDSRSLFS